MSDTARLVTAEELEKFPDDDYRYELVEGRIIRMSPVGFLHGGVTAGLLAMLVQHAKAHNLGLVATEVGFKLATNPDTVRAPDISFVRRERLPATGLPKGFWHGPPDLAVETLSPDDRPSEIRAKVEEYLTYGVTLVLVIDPDARTVAAHRRLAAPVMLTEDDELDLNDVVPGFNCRVREIFE
jgi:Uma2 family endonuclease